MDQARFKASRLHQAVVIRTIEIIGEAAGKVSRAVQEAHAEIPWAAIVGMRHRLIHGYNQVRLDLVWQVVRYWLPELVAVLQPQVSPLGDEDGTPGDAA